MTRSSLARPLGLIGLVAGVLALAGGSGFAGAAAAQTKPESPLAAAERLRQAPCGNVSIRWADATGVARFVRATNDATIPLATTATSPVDRANAFLQQYGAIFGVASPGTQLATKQVTSDATGSTVRLAQRYRSLPVFNPELVVNLDPTGGITAASGTFVPNVKVATQRRDRLASLLRRPRDWQSRLDGQRRRIALHRAAVAGGDRLRVERHPRLANERRAHELQFGRLDV